MRKKLQHKKKKTPTKKAKGFPSTTGDKIAQSPSGVQAIVPYTELLQPEMHQGKYTLIPTAFTENQILNIIAQTPKAIIKKRPGKGGGEWDYVPGWWFKKKLNYVFGFNWDFDILGERVDGNYITVKGKLTVKHPRTGDILASKTDYGGAEIKYKRGSKEYLDISNDFKAAATDSLKRCAVQLGFAMDVYGANELKTEGYQVLDDRPANDAPKKIAQPSTTITDYKAQLDAYLERLGCKNDGQKAKYIQYTLDVHLSDYGKLDSKGAQVILANLRKKGADQRG